MPVKDRLGQIYGRWTVLAPSSKRTVNQCAHWVCECSCGVRREVAGNSLESGTSRSCGCLTIEASKTRCGDRHSRWTGNSSEDDRERSRFRSVMQPKVFTRDSHTCQECGQVGGNLQVAHIKPWAEYPELRFDLTNCHTLCMACHYSETYGRLLPDGVIWGHNFSRRRSS